MDHPRKRLLPGLKILCPKCRRVMAIVRTEMQTGDVIKAEYFEAVDGVLVPGQPMTCPYDGTDYGLGGAKSMLYVTGYEGWV